MAATLKPFLLPLLRRRLQHIVRRGARLEVRSLHTQQPYRCTLFPVSEEKPPHFLINLRVELGRLFKRMGTRESSEIFVAQFQLDGTREISAFAQSPPYHFTQTHQRGLQTIQLGRVFVVGMLVAD